MLTQIEIEPETFLRQHCTLPALPEVVGQVQSMMSDDTTDIGKVADLISSEPALLAQILKVVNSAYYGLPKEITKARFAIAFLGYNEVYRMVLSLSVINTLSIKEKKDLTEFWFHSFYSAITTRHIANRYMPHLSFEDLWSAAMLHDIGKLIYLKYFPEHYKELKAYREEHACRFSEAEARLDRPTSSYMGTLLCEHWRLPDRIREACAHHDLEDLQVEEEEGGLVDFRRIIVLGNLLTTLASEELSDETRQAIVDGTMESLEVDEPEFLSLFGEIQELESAAQKFMVDLG